MMRLRSLGQCVIEVGDTRLTPAAETLFATALYLAMSGGRPVNRRELIELLWPSSDEAPAQHCLRQALYKLKSLGATLRSERTQVVLPADTLESDCGALLSAVEPARLEALVDGVAGPFLPGYTPRFSGRFAEWVERQRDLVGSAARRVLLAGISARKARGEWQAAELLAQKCLSIDPLNEEATLALAECAAASGSKVQALAVLDRYLSEIGPHAAEIRIPATILRHRIAEVYQGDALPVREAPFVGREEQMAELNRALRLASVAKGSACFVWGEAGIGKTRLVTEFTRCAGLRRVQIVRVGCQSSDERRPLSALVDLVPKLLELPGSLGCSPESHKYLRRLTEHDPHETTLSPDSRESELLFSSIRRSIFDLLDAVISESCVIIVVEDVHWLDRMSWELLREVVPWVATRRVLMILTSRNEAPRSSPQGRDMPPICTMRLGPLEDGASRHLLAALTAGTTRERNSRFREWCVESAGGNPYYLCELAQHACAEGDGFRPPLSLSALIGHRLSRLSALSRRVLQACCVLGKFSNLERLEGLLEEKPVELLSSLDELERAGLVRYEGTRLLSKHDLLSAAALSELSQLSRALLHRRAALTLEREVGQTQSAAVLWECAEHWKLAGERDRAINLLRTCARHSLEMGLPAEAASLLERASELAAGSEVMLPILTERSHALHLAGRWEELLSVLQLAARTHGATDNGREHSDHELLAAEATWRSGREITDLYERLQRCVSSSAASTQHRLRAAVLALILADNLCLRDEPHALFDEIAPLLSASDAHEILRQQILTIYHCSFGDHAQALCASKALIDLERSRTLPNLCQALRYGSEVSRVCGFMDDSVGLATKAFNLAEQVQLRSAASAAACQLVHLNLQLDNVLAAGTWFERARLWSDAQPGSAEDMNLRGNGVSLALKERRYEEAARLLAEIEHFSTRCHPARRAARATAQYYQLRLLRDGAVLSETEVESLLQLHYRTRDRTDQDCLTSVLYRAFVGRGAEGDARALVHDYVRMHRRERSPLEPELAEIVASIGN